MSEFRPSVICAPYHDAFPGSLAWSSREPPLSCNTHLIADPPYGARVHSAETTRSDDSDAAGLTPRYPPWNPSDVDAYVRHFADKITGWWANMTSHDLLEAWERAYERIGLYAFAPVSCIIRGGTVRVRGDGPSSGTIYLMVARPRGGEFASWGTLPGYYIGPRVEGAGGGRGKPDWLMQAIVADYSKPGDLVVDPVCGWGSTLAAAETLGRYSVGSDSDADACIEARRRLGDRASRGLQVDMFR